MAEETKEQRLPRRRLSTHEWLRRQYGMREYRIHISWAEGPDETFTTVGAAREAIEQQFAEYGANPVTEVWAEGLQKRDPLIPLGCTWTVQLDELN